ncbi:MAG: hypothetical protein ABIZ50_07780 [Solirubrobacterales bacterium]
MFAENLALRLIGLLTTIAILGATYLFIVKPILDTTNKAFDSFGDINDTMQQAFDDAGINGVSAEDVRNRNFGDVREQLQHSGLDTQQQRQAEKLLHCVQRVQPDTTAMQACAEKFQP